MTSLCKFSFVGIWFICASTLAPISNAQVPKGEYMYDVKVFKGKPFQIVDEIHNWSHKFDNVHYEAKLYDDSANVIRACKEVRDKEYEKVLERDGHPGGSYRLRLNDSIARPGVFYLGRTVTGLGEGGKEYTRRAYWKLIVQEIILDQRPDAAYYYGESAYFNFASGHPDYQQYSYDIVRLSGSKPDTVVPLTPGPSVALDLVTKNIQNFKGENWTKSYLIRGYYNGKPFQYRNATSDSMTWSTWLFKVKVPTLNCNTIWGELGGESSDTTDGVEMRTFLPYDAREFSYIYLGRKDSTKYIIVTPQIKNPKVISSAPEDFVDSYDTDVASPWSIVRIVPNENIVTSKRKKKLRIEITISFDTQLEHFTKTYEVYIY